MKISIGSNPYHKVEADIYLHPLRIENGKKMITYEPESEEAVVALIAQAYVKESCFSAFFDSLDEGYLSSESNFDAFDLDEVMTSDTKVEITVGPDILKHPKADNILALLHMINKYSDVKVDKTCDQALKEVSDLKTYDGAVVYIDESETNDTIVVSKQFMTANKIAQKKFIKVDGKEKKVFFDPSLKGVYGIIYEACEEYPFKKVNIE